MTRRQFLTLLGFHSAASSCSRRLILGKSVPIPYETDEERIYYSDDGMQMVRFHYGRPVSLHKLAVEYDENFSLLIPWPKEVEHLFGEPKCQIVKQNQNST